MPPDPAGGRYGRQPSPNSVGHGVGIAVLSEALLDSMAGGLSIQVRCPLTGVSGAETDRSPHPHERSFAWPHPASGQ